MAHTAEGTRLTEWHRTSQLVLRSAVLRSLVALWPAFSLANIDATWPALETALLLLIGQARTRSASLAKVYYGSYRAAEGIRDVLPADPPALPWEQAARVSLTVTGPIAAKQAIAAGRKNAADIALVRLSGSVGRLVLDGGRDVVTGFVANERQRIGWIRVTSPEPCAFCAMLASRGPVYSEFSVGFQAHDHCACEAEPVIRNDRTTWPQRNQEFLATWNDATRGLVGVDATRAFRKAIEGSREAA